MSPYANPSASITITRLPAGDIRTSCIGDCEREATWQIVNSIGHGTVPYVQTVCWLHLPQQVELRAGEIATTF